MKKQENIGDLVTSAIRLWGKSGFKRKLFFVRIAWQLWRGNKRHNKQEKKLGLKIPTILAISPTMRCNYTCYGCYSKGRSVSDELTINEIDNLFKEAGDYGVTGAVVTGGEPLMKEGLVNLLSKHKRLLFIMITNGSLMTEQIAKKISESRNIVVLVSIDGYENENTKQRGKGVYESSIKAFNLLKKQKAFFGFASVNTMENSAILGSDEFVDKMIEYGCSLGLYTEYVPCGKNEKKEWLVTKEERDRFRKRITGMRNKKTVMLVQFPQDEYGEENLCTGAGRASLHINSQGGIEPCPFVSISVDNIRNGGFIAACKSLFMNKIRGNMDLLRRNKYACSLFEHKAEVNAIKNALTPDNQCSPKEKQTAEITT